MNWQANPYSLPLAVSALTALVFAAIAWRRRQLPVQFLWLCSAWPWQPGLAPMRFSGRRRLWGRKSFG